MTFIHGNLFLEISEAQDLPDVDFSMLPWNKDLSDPYVKLEGHVQGEKLVTLAKTRVIEQELNPNWNSTFHIPLCHELDSFVFAVKDYDLQSGDDTMCQLVIHVDEFLEENSMEGWFPLMQDEEEKGQIRIHMNFTPLADINLSNMEVPRTPFPIRRNCGVKLYQDAHTPAKSPIIDIPTADGEPYEPSSYFADVVKAIEKAQKLVYIAGWSVNPERSLLRNREEDNESLGELLKRKSEEDVRVLVMVWNELLSTELLGGFELNGLMQTHDEATVQYFEGTNVEVLNAPRNYSNGKALTELAVTGSFTHHQKCVIVDKKIKHDDRRGIAAFVGGIDLTDGRWDTFEHSLFKTLPHEHKDDFYQMLLTSDVNTGPREPWHDIHLYVDGPAAVDVLQNYAERWRCQASDRSQCLVPLTEEEFDLEAKGGGGWHAQFFRSINADSVTFDVNCIQNVRSLKGKNYESSIQDAYIYHIRRARKFIYMENQYFLGSSHCWETPDRKCCHLIPIELCKRITRAIEEGEDFRVYVVCPMFPEGIPTTDAVQEILSFQRFTMTMMYKRIASAIEEAGIDAHPTDYLSFFCLAKRESPEDVPEEIGMPEDEENEVLMNVRTTLRSMIYVHSKMAIFDDEYIIVGSANINQRSMDGNRDSEMCIGAYQPKFIDCEDDLKGDVQKFRLALWAEHCGETMEIHLSPSSVDCMVAMKEVGLANVEKYVQCEPEGNSSHLLSYPLTVGQDGEVTENESFPEFPDLGGSVQGAPTDYIPNFITT